MTVKVENRDKPEDKTISIPTNNESSSCTKSTKINKNKWVSLEKWKKVENRDKPEDSERKSHRSGVVFVCGHDELRNDASFSLKKESTENKKILWANLIYTDIAKSTTPLFYELML